MSIAGTDLFAALPIREQPTVPPESGLEPIEIAFFATLLIGGLVIAIAVTISRERRGGNRLEVDEDRIRAEMDRLCRQGWTAQLTLYGDQAQLSEDAPDRDGVRVRLDWAELAEDEDGDRETAVARRLWSRSISTALRAMVEDRRIDKQLEEIERAHAPRGPSGGRG